MLITERITVGGFPAKLSSAAKGIGFTVEPNMVIGGTSGAVIAPNYRYKLNGVDQLFLIEPAQSTDTNDVTISFDFVANADNAGHLAGGQGSGLLTWRVGVSGGIVDAYRANDFAIDGVSYGNGDSFTLDGLTHRASIRVPGNSYRAYVTAVGGSYNSDTLEASSFSNTSFENIEITTGGVTSVIPANVEAQGATQLPTSGSVYLTILNYDASGWS